MKHQTLIFSLLLVLSNLRSEGQVAHIPDYHDDAPRKTFTSADADLGATEDVVNYTLRLAQGGFQVKALPDSCKGPYRLSLKRELLIGGAGVVTTTIGTVLFYNVPDLTKGEVVLDGINKFDRIAARYSSDKAANLSDKFLYAGAIMPLALLIDPKIRSNAFKVGVMFTEATLLTTGLTTLIKSTAQRARPYVYDENLPLETILTNNDRAAFLSGHTSAAATASFFFAKVYADYNPNSKAKPFVWAGAAALPAVTGFLRVRAGRHYPTDVIAGYLLGASIGIFVPELHKKAKKVQGLSFSPSTNGFYASYTF